MNIEDLPDSPLPASPVEDARTTDWYQFLQELDEALITYSWAADTLDGIRETVEKTHRVTEGQRRAVTNICQAEGQQASRRRYEGHSRRYR